jgi:hypothetical protein
MGYYIPNETPIELRESVQPIDIPDNFSEVPQDKALICAVDNYLFKAYGYCFSQGEFEAFTYPEDDRPKRWYLMDKALAEKLSGYKSKN